MSAHDLDAYLTKRAIAVDDALADGSYEEWPEHQIEIPVEYLGALRALADRKGCSVPDLIAAITAQRAREEIQQLLWE